MLKLIEKITPVKGTRAAGIEMQLTGNSYFKANVSIVRKSGSDISLVKSFRRLVSYESVKDVIPASLPVALTIDGKGIIYKKVKYEPGSSLLNYLLPNAQEKDFYVFKYPSTGGMTYLAAIRKDLLNDILNEFKKNGILVVHIDIGPFPVNNILQSLDYQSHLKISHYRIEGDKLISSIERNTKEYAGFNYKLGTENLDSLSVISFSTGINHFIRGLDSIELDESRWRYKEYLYGKLIKTAGMLFLSLLFFGLMINYYYFDRFNNQHNHLSFQLSQNKNLIAKIDTLKNELDLKRQFIEKRGYLNATRLSYYSDRIAASVPGSVILSMLEINPSKGKIKPDEEIAFLKNEILIQGTTRKNMVLNAWMRQLKKKTWIHSVRLISYKRKKPDEPGEFKLRVKL